MQPRISFITLGVEDLARSTRFYSQGLGLTILKSLPEVTFFEMGKTWLALFPRHSLSEDAGVPLEQGGFSRVALAHNVATVEQVALLLDQAVAAGGRKVKTAQVTAWGGVAGYFADPDGILWEVAWNPHFPHGG